MNKTPISLLQEVVVAKKMALPDYTIDDCGDIPGANFKCTVKFDKFRACGYGLTKKSAKHNSAQQALKLMGFVGQSIEVNLVPNCNRSTIHQPKKIESFINYVGILNEYASTNGQMYPTYIEEVVPSTGGFATICIFLKNKTRGHGLKKKDSKQDAAKKMLEWLRTEDVSKLTEMVSQLHLQKLERNDEEVLKKYKAISTPDFQMTSTTPELHIKPIPNLRNEVRTLDELKSELEKCGYRYTIESFQRQPYIMMMKINGSIATIMGRGDTKEEALTELYEMALYMFERGFSM